MTEQSRARGWQRGENALIAGGSAAGGAAANALVLIAFCWSFHVAVDRAFGFGLKLDTFSHTHLSADT